MICKDIQFPVIAGTYEDFMSLFFSFALGKSGGWGGEGECGGGIEGVEYLGSSILL